MSDTEGLPDDFEPWMAEGVRVTVYCPRGRTDCSSLAQIIAGEHKSFSCCGENDGSTRQVPQDKYRLCFKSEFVDELSDCDKRDLAHHLGVIASALAVIEERDSAEYHNPPSDETDHGPHEGIVK
jgi:hypothetical protein